MLACARDVGGRARGELGIGDDLDFVLHLSFAAAAVSGPTPARSSPDLLEQGPDLDAATPKASGTLPDSRWPEHRVQPSTGPVPSLVHRGALLPLLLASWPPSSPDGARRPPSRITSGRRPDLVALEEVERSEDRDYVGSNGFENRQRETEVLLLCTACILYQPVLSPVQIYNTHCHVKLQTMGHNTP
jgi:hypothetical protein